RALRRRMGVMKPLFERMERLVPATTPPPAPPPAGLLAFYWHFMKQAKGLFLALLGAGLMVALLDAAIPVFIGRIVNLVATLDARTLVEQEWPLLAVMAGAVLVLRPLAILTRALISNQAIAAGFSNLVRWQSHWQVVRQSWAFFQNDFAGRIANKVMQTGPALRETVVAAPGGWGGGRGRRGRRGPGARPAAPPPPGAARRRPPPPRGPRPPPPAGPPPAPPTRGAGRLPCGPPRPDHRPHGRCPPVTRP